MLLFCDKAKKLVEAVKEAWPDEHYVRCEFVKGDVIPEAAKRGLKVVSCSNPSFSMGGGLDLAIKKAYPDECDAPEANKSTVHLFFQVTVDDKIKAESEIVKNALRQVIGNRHLGLAFTGFGTGIGGFGTDDFVSCLKEVLNEFASDEGAKFHAVGLKGFKATSDGMKCRDYQFKVGDAHESGCDDPKLCQKGGFHFCRVATEVLDFYSDPNHLLEVEANGICRETKGKLCASLLKVVKDLTCQMKEAPYLNTGDRNTGNLNTGDWNTGDRNTGNLNTGNLNTGDLNTGDRNTGDRNTGDWNTGDRNTGCFNVDAPDEIRCFGKMVKRVDWERANKPWFLYFKPVKWIGESEMTDKEKGTYPQYVTTGGFLKVQDYKRAFIESYEALDSKEKATQTAMLKALPGFDADIFRQISGITIK